MNLARISLMVGMASILGLACKETSTYERPSARTSKNAANGTGGSGGGSGSDNVNGTAEGESFFEGKLVAAFRKSSETCLDCHDAPRNVLGNPDAASEAIYNYDRMFSLLKQGSFSNDNAFINPLLGKTSHPGKLICEDESAELCQLAIEWYQMEFASGGSKYGEVEGVDISFSGVNVKGYAKDIASPDTRLTVRVYLDGEAGSGTMIGEDLADGFESAYNFRLDNSVRDNGEHELYLYAVVNGKEELLGGSPFKFRAYTPGGAGVFPGTGALGLNAGCGCHEGGFNYEGLWPDLIVPIGGSAAPAGTPIGPQNNFLYDMATGTRGTNHPGGQVGNAAAISDWWCDEFDPDRNDECTGM